MTYDPAVVRSYFDALGEREWQRLETTFQGRAAYAVHKRFLDAHARAGAKVLDIGSGPGRYAIDLISRGAEVVVADLSPVQVELARQRITEQGLNGPSVQFRELDVTNLSMFGDASFDLVVCYGGVLSYTRERHTQALRELARVVRPGGIVLLSVMSLYGTMRLIGPLDAAAVVESMDQHLDWAAVKSGAQIIYTHTSSKEFHQPIALFTSRALRDAVEVAGLVVETLASASAIITQYARVPNIDASPTASAEMQRLEIELCDYPGLVDAGSHLIAVARRPARTLNE